MQKRTQISGPIKVIQIIHISILGSALIFGGFIFLLINSTSTLLGDLNNLLIYMPLLSALFFVPMSNILFSKKLQSNLSEKDELKGKLIAFQTAHITRIAMLEIVAFLSIITCLVTHTSINFITFILIFLYLTILFPTLSRVAETLRLSQAERLQLETN